MKHGFSQTRLRRYVERAGMAYCHLPGLGVPRELRSDLADADHYRRLFSLCSRDILPTRIADIAQLRPLIEAHGRVALTCFERDPESCQRHRITEHLVEASAGQLEVVHL